MARKGKRNVSTPSTAPVMYVECPHLHFKADTIDRGILSRTQHLNLLSTPKGYRWDIIKKKGGDMEESSSSVNVVPCKERKVYCGRRIKKPEKTYIHNFLAEIWALLTPEMIERLKELLMDEFGMTPTEAEEFILDQKEKSIMRSSTVSMIRSSSDGSERTKICVRKTPKTVCCCKFPKTCLGIRHYWVKEFSKMLAAKITDYVVMMLCARRTKRVRMISEIILKHLCDITGEKCTLSTPKTRVQRILVFAADRLAIWLAGITEETDKKREHDRIQRERGKGDEDDRSPDDRSPYKRRPDGRGTDERRPDERRQKPRKPMASEGRPGAQPGGRTAPAGLKTTTARAPAASSSKPQARPATGVSGPSPKEGKAIGDERPKTPKTPSEKAAAVDKPRTPLTSKPATPMSTTTTPPSQKPQTPLTPPMGPSSKPATPKTGATPAPPSATPPSPKPPTPQATGLEPSSKLATPTADAVSPKPPSPEESLPTEVATPGGAEVGGQPVESKETSETSVKTAATAEPIGQGADTGPSQSAAEPEDVEKSSAAEIRPESSEATSAQPRESVAGLEKPSTAESSGGGADASVSPSSAEQTDIAKGDKESSDAVSTQPHENISDLGRPSVVEPGSGGADGGSSPLKTEELASSRKEDESSDMTKDESKGFVQSTEQEQVAGLPEGKDTGIIEGASEVEKTSTIAEEPSEVGTDKPVGSSGEQPVGIEEEKSVETSKKEALEIGEKGPSETEEKDILEKGEISPLEKGEISPLEKGEISPLEKGEISPLEKGEISPLEKGEISPLEKGGKGPLEISDQESLETVEKGPLETGEEQPPEISDKEQLESSEAGPLETGETVPSEISKMEPLEIGKDGVVEPSETEGGLPSSEHAVPAGKEKEPGEEEDKVHSVMGHVTDWIERTEPEGSPRQEALESVLGKKLEEEIPTEDQLTSEAIHEVSKRVSTWVDKIITDIESEYGVKERPPSRGAVYRIRKDGNDYEVKPISQAIVKDKVPKARGRIQPEQYKPKNVDPLKPSDMKEWAKWAADVVSVAEQWADWIDKTCADAETKAVRNKDQEEFKKWQDKTQEDALEWRRNKKLLKDVANMWQQKTEKTKLT